MCGVVFLHLGCHCPSVRVNTTQWRSVSFYSPKMKNSNQVSTVGHSNPQKTRLSRRTSCSAGTPLVTSRDPFLQKRRGESTRRYATQQNCVRTSSRTFLAQTLLWLSQVPPLNSAVSPDRLPHFCTQDDKACAPLFTTNSGHVLSFLLRTSSRAAPLWSAALLAAVPSHYKVDTIVVSTATCAPSKIVKPSTTISKRLASTGLPPSMSRFLTMIFVDTAPVQIPWIPTPPPPRTLLDGGHGSRGDGHIGRCGRRNEWRGGDAGTATLVDRDVENATNTLQARRSFSGFVKLG